MNTFTCIHIYVYMLICIYRYNHINGRLSIYICENVYIHMYAYMHRYIRTYILTSTRKQPIDGWIDTCMRAILCAHACICVRVREKEREGEIECVYMCVCVCVCVCLYTSIATLYMCGLWCVNAYECVCVREREGGKRERGSVCVYVCVYVCVCVCAYKLMTAHYLFWLCACMHACVHAWERER